MIITNSRYALVGYFITSYPTRAHGIIVIYHVVKLQSEEFSKVKWCIYIAPLSLTSQGRFTMINLPPADWKHIQAQIAAASKQSMHAGTHFTDLGRMES